VENTGEAKFPTILLKEWLVVTRFAFRSSFFLWTPGTMGGAGYLMAVVVGEMAILRQQQEANSAKCLRATSIPYEAQVEMNFIMAACGHIANESPLLTLLACSSSPRNLPFGPDWNRCRRIGRCNREIEIPHPLMKSITLTTPLGAEDRVGDNALFNNNRMNATQQTPLRRALGHAKTFNPQAVGLTSSDGDWGQVFQKIAEPQRPDNVFGG